MRHSKPFRPHRLGLHDHRSAGRLARRNPTYQEVYDQCIADEKAKDAKRQSESWSSWAASWVVSSPSAGSISMCETKAKYAASEMGGSPPPAPTTPQFAPSAAPQQFAPSGAPAPAPTPSKEDDKGDEGGLTDSTWFWPVVILSGSAAAAGTIYYFFGRNQN